jgi:hypothetical protein
MRRTFRGQTAAAAQNSAGGPNATVRAVSAVGIYLVYCSARPPVPCSRCTAGGFLVPLRIEGDVSFGQYMRYMGRKSPLSGPACCTPYSTPL